MKEINKKTILHDPNHLTPVPTHFCTDDYIMQDNLVAESTKLGGYWKVLYNIRRVAKPFKSWGKCRILSKT